VTRNYRPRQRKIFAAYRLTARKWKWACLRPFAAAATQKDRNPILLPQLAPVRLELSLVVRSQSGPKGKESFPFGIRRMAREGVRKFLWYYVPVKDLRRCKRRTGLSPAYLRKQLLFLKLAEFFQIPRRFSTRPALPAAARRNAQVATLVSIGKLSSCCGALEQQLI
jgi:hypothetical protein